MKPMKTSQIMVIGGGIIGLAAALELAKRGKKVVIVEKGSFGGQATGAAAGMLAPYSEIGEDPDDFFTMCHKSLQLYPEWQKEVKEISGASFEYNRSGSLHVVFHEADELVLETRHSWQKKWNVDSEIVRGESLRKLELHLTKEIIAAMYYPEEHHLYTPDFVIALRQACEKLGVTLLEQSGEVAFKEIRPDGITLETQQQGDIAADECIVCNGAWTPFLEADLKMKLPVFPIRGQICAYEQGNEKINHMVFSSQGYMVAKGNGSIVCGASEDIAGYDTTVTEKGIHRLINWSKKLYPFLADKDPFHRWAGLRPATQDGFPLIGRLPHFPNVIISSGHYRNGILLSTVNAKIVADLVENNEPIVNIASFNPMRFQ
jgi:glycine oxidase